MKKYLRTITQSLSLVLLNFSWGPEAKWLCAPVLNCHACPLAWFACPIGVLAQFAGYHVFPFLALGILLLIGALLGRLLCGWICPFGFLQDLLFKIKTRKFTLPRWMGYIKYVILLSMVFLLPYLFGSESAGVFCYSCPMAGVQVALPNTIKAAFAGVTAMTWYKLGLTAAVLILVVFSSRAFCKAFCPLGALLAPLNLIAFWTIRMPQESCRACRLCDTACTMEGNPSARVSAGVPVNRLADCVGCYDCKFACPVIDGKEDETKTKQPAS